MNATHTRVSGVNLQFSHFARSGSVFISPSAFDIHTLSATQFELLTNVAVSPGRAAGKHHPAH
jgi:hypothetical protein